MRKIERNEEAVSPVIGVILMVAITVILAAVIAAFVFGMVGGVGGSKSVGVTSQYSGFAADGITPGNYVIVTYQGGVDDSKLSYLTIKVNTAAAQDTIIGAALAASPAAAPVKPNVGDKFYYVDAAAGGTSTAGKNKVTVTGTFVDGSKQVLLDTTT